MRTSGCTTQRESRPKRRFGLPPASWPLLFAGGKPALRWTSETSRCVWCALVVTSSALCAAPWKTIESDQPVDPRLVRGTLPNGLRYAILPNGEPRERVSVRLLVAVGSLHETDTERGLAHFVEHMAFRGTRAFPAGSLTAALQRLGVGFGPDNTAFTGYEHTIYHLELPDTKDATLHEGLRALREYADGVTFDEKLIDRERGVLLSEMATRNTPHARAGEANLLFLWPDARHARRKIIGDPAQLRTFTRQQFLTFYDAWYRPERMAIVLVGDVHAITAEKIVREHFANLAGRGAPGPEPADLEPIAVAPADVAVFSDPGLLGFTFAFQHPRHRPAVDTHAERTRSVHESLAFAMFQSRLQRIAQAPEASFVTPSASLAPGLGDWQIASVTVAGRLDDWQTVATDVELEHRRAFQFGFTARELEDARATFATGLQQATRSAASRDSSALAQHLAHLVLRGGTLTTPAENERELAPILAAATPADCLAAFRAVWSTKAPSVFISAHPSFNITRERIAAVLNQSRQQAITAPPDVAKSEFAYTHFGAPGAIVSQERLPDLDVTLSRFANGVRLNFKPTPFTADIVDFRIRIGDGKLAQLRSQPGLDLLGNLAFTAGGVGRHTAIELRDILAGRALQLGFQVQSDACVFSGRCARRDLEFALRVVAAYLTDASFRPEVMREARAWYGSMYASLAASPGGPVTAFAPRLIFDDDPRFGIPEYDQLLARHLGELEAWMTPQLQSGPVELSIVGDTTWEEARQAVAATLGALPERADPAPNRNQAVTFTPVRKLARPTIFTTASTLQQVALAWYWPAPDVTTIEQDRRCNLLARILADRLRVRLRDELGATYSPDVHFLDVDGFDGSGHFIFYAEVQPARAGQAMRIVHEAVNDLFKKGPKADEFDRAKPPYLREMSDNLRTNLYWAATVLEDAQQRPQRIAAARSRAQDIQAIKRGELVALAKKYFNPDRAFIFATVPATEAPKAPPAANAAP